MVQTLHKSDSLFYTDVCAAGGVQLKAMIDSGSMSCSLSEVAAARLLQNCPDLKASPANDIVVIGAGGHHVYPTAVYDLEVTIYGFQLLIPTLVIPGQTDDMIVGSNAIKMLIHLMKQSDDYWRLLASPVDTAGDESSQFLSVLSNSERWQGGPMPDRIGTVKLKKSVTLEPLREHLVWGKLPASAPLSVGSTVIVEPTQSRARPRNVLVGRVVTPLWGDRWVPLKLINPTSEAVTLRRNCKIADVFPCVAVEELSLPEKVSVNSQSVTQSSVSPKSPEQRKETLSELGLHDLDLDGCEVSDHWKDRLLQLIGKYESVFSRNKMDCGETTDFVHKIHLVDERPFRLPYRRVPPSQYEKLRTALNEMEEKGIIRKSHSEYASPLVLVWKKDGSLRICTDFRWLNAKTVKDAHPLPHQADALAALGGNVFFSTMDLTSGFYNVPLYEAHKKYTAFSSPFGLHEYNRMPQGLCNSPATFMRMMLSIFGDENFSSLLCYLDDLLVFAPTEQQALERLETVFSRLKNHKLKLAPKKCHLLKRSVRFLGHIISADGVRTDPDKVRAIADVGETELMESDGVTPSWRKIRSFLGMIFYYQHFIADCSAKAKPLFRLISGRQAQPHVRKGRRSKKKSSAPPALRPSDWTAACRESFQALKNELTHSVTLAHPNFSEPFILAVDASFDGIGAVLSQVSPGETIARPVAFASKTLSRSQMNYPAHKLEFLALKWAIYDKFSHWLKGRHFTAWTDNNPLSYILTKPRLDACEQRWVAKLAAYDFDLKYVPGVKNTVADALSREPFVQSCVGHRLLKEPYITLLNEVNGVVNGTVQDAFRLTNNCQVVKSAGSQPPDPGVMPDTQPEGSISSDEVSAALGAHVGCGLTSFNLPLPQLPEGDSTTVIPQSQLSSLQERDGVISRALFYMRRKRKATRREAASEPDCVNKLLRHWKKLKIMNGILYRVKKDHLLNKKLFQFVVPDDLKPQILLSLHDNAGHQGRARTLSLARERFFWIGMEKDIIYHVAHCERCIVGKTLEPEARAPLENILTSEPMELVCIDFWTAELGDKKTVDVLVITDHFSKMAHAFPCRSQSAKHVARRLWDDFFCVYGFPKRIHSDQGPNFESRLLKELLEMAGVQKSHTTPYHPMGNGVTERFNRTLGNMLRTLPANAKARWPQLLRSLTFSYNCTKHETTNFAPFYLMFGRVPRLPIDIMFQHVLHDARVVSHNDFVSGLKQDLCEASQIALKHSLSEQARHARLYNRKVKGSPLAVGDRVLLANRGERGKRKLADKWNSTPYDVVSVRSGINVYRIRDARTGREKVVHRNLLLPVNFLTLDVENPVPPDNSGDRDATCGSDRDPVEKDNIEGHDRTLDWLMRTAEFTDPVSGNVSADEEYCARSDSLSDSVPSCAAVGSVPEPSLEVDIRVLPAPTTEVWSLESASIPVAHLPEAEPSSVAHLSGADPIPVAHLPEPASVSLPTLAPADNVENVVICTQPPSVQAGFGGTVTTRLGRHVRPPRRLISEMSAQRVREAIPVTSSIIA
uniref:Gypsy retrotransposon integrase-like protein 1 n=1 Tax=Acanthochromis polyacanthus TaxID=80966 RepID=A0A3Q1FAW3_9TELE